MHLFMLCLACRTFVMEWCLAVAQTFCCGPDLLPRNAHLLGEKDRDTARARERGRGEAVKGRVGRGGEHALTAIPCECCEGPQLGTQRDCIGGIYQEQGGRAAVRSGSVSRQRSL